MAAVTQDPEAWARLGAKIRERREELGMSRRQLSEIAGVSEKSIQVAEEGRPPRARWPQSLRLIEPAIRWAPGSMAQVVNGGEPEAALDLFHFAREESLFGEPKGRQRELGVAIEREAARRIEGMTAHQRSRILASLPKPVRDSLDDVLAFGGRTLAYGADPELVAEYERAVGALILASASKRDLEVWPVPAGDLEPWRRAMLADPYIRQRNQDSHTQMLREQYQATRSARNEAIRKYAAANRDPEEKISRDEVLQELRVLADRVAELAEEVKKAEGDGDAE